MTPRRKAPAALAALALLGVVTGLTWAAFASTTSNSGNALSAYADWTPPLVNSTTIQKTTGGIPAGGQPGAIKQGGSYRVYANVADDPSGNPPAGVASATANVSSLTTGQTAVALSTTGGPFTVAGTSYAYGSASLTANNPLTAGAKTYSITATDSASPANSRTLTNFPVTVDNTAPSGTDVTTTNKTGGTVGKPEQGDTIKFTYSETMDPYTILDNWTGASTNVTVRILDDATSTSSHDEVAIYDSANTTRLKLGPATGTVVDLGRTNSVSATATFTNSTTVQSGGNITITLGTLSSGTPITETGSRNPIWNPSASALDPAGNASSTTQVTGSVSKIAF